MARDDEILTVQTFCFSFISQQVYWVLDLAFNEDACRIRKDFAPENLAVVRHIALNLLTKENTLKLGIKNKVSVFIYSRR